jgi:ATP adenylyltransferase
MALEYGDIRLQYEDYSPGAVAGGAGLATIELKSMEAATDAEVAEIALLTQQAMQALQNSSGKHGFNIGMKQGEVAGAGIAAHLHQHVVPRWANDSNFFPIIAQTKALPMLLGEVRTEIAAAWPKG